MIFNIEIRGRVLSRFNFDGGPEARATKCRVGATRTVE
jgi:hypothetical protein